MGGVVAGPVEVILWAAAVLAVAVCAAGCSMAVLATIAFARGALRGRKNGGG